MADDPRVRLIATHVRSICAQEEPGGELLAAAIIRRCRPDGDDCTAPAALQWVRRWGPNGPAYLPPVCSCAGGRCAVCN
ncbi:MAG TPA: hypothetical protein VN672_08910 [Solirubrobacteraceae bacterium]|nr:hypothetical protein [Solirubrobacteraceae bacterium]